MAIGRYGVNDAMAVKLWARKVEFEALKASPIAPLIGTSADSIVHRKDELSKGPGDKVSFTLFTQLTGDGVTEGTTLEGNEESLTNYDDSILVNELHHAIRIPNGGQTIDVQRVPFNLRSTGKHLMRDWFAKRISVSFFNQVCGNTAESDTKYTGLNATVAPTSARHLLAGGQSNDQSLTSTDTMTVDLVMAAKEMAQTVSPKVKPINPRIMNVNGGEVSDSGDVLEEKYCMYLHPYQVFDLKRDMSDGQWYDIQQAAMQGGQISKNAIYSGALGEIDGVILKRADDIPLGVNSSTSATVSDTRRAVLLGAQAAAYATSKNGGDTRYRWVEDTFDYERELGISVQSLWGLKKCVFNSVDYGTIVISTYAAAHTSV